MVTSYFMLPLLLAAMLILTSSQALPKNGNRRMDSKESPAKSNSVGRIVSRKSGSESKRDDSSKKSQSTTGNSNAESFYNPDSQNDNKIRDRHYLVVLSLASITTVSFCIGALYAYLIIDANNANN